MSEKGIEEIFAAATDSKLTEVVEDGQVKQIEPQQEQPAQETKEEVKAEEPQKQANTAPAEETPKEQADTNRSLSNEKTMDQPKKADSSTEMSEEQMLKILGEKTGKSFNSFDQVKEQFSKETPKLDFASEKMAKINQFIKETGRSVEDYLKTQELNFDKMDTKQVVLEHMKAKNPDLSQKEIQVLFDDTYKIDEDAEEGDVSVDSIKLKRAASEAKSYFNDLKEKYSKPSEDKVQTQAKYKEIREEWLGNMKKQVNDLQAIEFKVGNENFQYSLDENARKTITDMNSSLGENFFINRYFNKDTGNWDIDKLSVEMFALEHMDDIVNAAVAQFSNKKTEQVVKDMKNVNMGAKASPPQTDVKTIADQILDAMNDE